MRTMSKTIKKMMALVIAMVMVIGTMSMTVFATDAGKGKITVSTAQGKAVYEQKERYAEGKCGGNKKSR